MKKITYSKAAKIYGGDWEDRLYKQNIKCDRGVARACRRATRIQARHQ